MKRTAIIKICVDAVMYLLFLLLMGQYLLRDAPHEWLGLAAGVFLSCIIYSTINDLLCQKARHGISQAGVR